MPYYHFHLPRSLVPLKTNSLANTRRGRTRLECFQNAIPRKLSLLELYGRFRQGSTHKTCLYLILLGACSVQITFPPGVSVENYHGSGLMLWLPEMVGSSHCKQRLTKKLNRKSWGNEMSIGSFAKLHHIPACQEVYMCAYTGQCGIPKSV